MTQRIIEITSPSFIREDQLKEAATLDGFFETVQPLALEIGCGIGDFITQLAARHPDRNFIAIDIYNKGCYKTCKKVDLAGLKNVRVIRTEARFLLANHLRKESLSAIYINCPDPWPKKRHRSRRLVREDFMKLALLYLVPGGDFYFASDFTDYAVDVAGAMGSISGFSNCQSEPLTTSLPDYPLSKYMRKFLAQGLPIYFVHHRKRADCSVTELALSIQQGFRMNWNMVENG